MAKERFGIKNGIPSGKEDNKIDNKEESDDYSVGEDIESLNDYHFIQEDLVKF